MAPSDSVRAGIGARSSRALHSTLVVEDDPRSGRLMQSILSDLSDEVVLASNAAAALDCLAGSNFSLVTLDLGLPDLPGIDLLRTIREQTDTPDHRRQRRHIPSDPLGSAIGPVEQRPASRCRSAVYNPADQCRPGKTRRLVRRSERQRCPADTCRHPAS